MPAVRQVCSHVFMLAAIQCIYLEPVNGAAVDERWEHPESVAEGVSNGAHSQNHVEMCLHSLNEKVVHGQRCGINLATL